MKILLLDTSSKFLSLAVAEEGKILSQTHRLLDRKHSLQLVPLIDKTLKKAKTSLRQIHGFCVGKGPGSFTGLRIGITTIKGLAFVLQKPVVALSSLDILAQNVKKVKLAKRNGSSLQVCPIVDAKQNKVYTCLYRFGNGIIRRKTPYFLLPIAQLLKKIKGEVLFLGDGVKIYRKEICTDKKIRPIFVAEKFCYPRVCEALSSALQRFRQGKLDDVNSLVPLYLYPKECQIKNKTR